MNILMAADVLLDSHPFGAVKTAFIALAAGTPLRCRSARPGSL